MSKLIQPEVLELLVLDIIINCPLFILLRIKLVIYLFLLLGLSLVFIRNNKPVVKHLGSDTDRNMLYFIIQDLSDSNLVAIATIT